MPIALQLLWIMSFTACTSGSSRVAPVLWAPSRYHVICCGVSSAFRLYAYISEDTFIHKSHRMRLNLRFLSQTGDFFTLVPALIVDRICLIAVCSLLHHFLFRLMISYRESKFEHSIPDCDSAYIQPSR